VLQKWAVTIFEERHEVALMK